MRERNCPPRSLFCDLLITWFFDDIACASFIYDGVSRCTSRDHQRAEPKDDEADKLTRGLRMRFLLLKQITFREIIAFAVIVSTARTQTAQSFSSVN